MPGYVIHLAVAEEYLKKHTNKKENYNDFIEGVIFPDSVSDKSLTHYGNGSSNTNLYKFIKSNKIETSFNRGHFLHLLTDYLFYNKYISAFSKDIYNDYDILNKELVAKYNVTLPDKVKEYVYFKDDTGLKLLSRKLIDIVIEEVSDIDLDEVFEEIEIEPEKWTVIRPLKKL